MMNSSHAMKTCVLILLVALLCAERAQGLRCYQCLGVTPETSCQPALCQYPDGVCINQEVEVTVESYKEKRKNKFCLPTCPEDQDPLGNFPHNPFITASVSSKLSCCKGDLCNAAVPTGGSIWTLAGVLLVSLGSVLLQTLL
ncbi:lymphocyte antigen 6S isoform X2 [Peromyscus maniculatus bairdii]|nr:lymphocyte antigen 6A-2/6E-1-like isoform X2 [Peromyscus maniculatus bairdii]XP_015863226.1 lymphocyte antigen 6A-2/6E-1-like isoform X1 [Peromyscus maniculatus bairdii]